jgi:hypothetical protein
MPQIKVSPFFFVGYSCALFWITELRSCPKGVTPILSIFHFFPS